MSFGWINWINIAVVDCLICINLVAVRKGVAGSFCSKYPVVNVMEQIGRYGCMAFMILPVFTSGWEFGFRTVAEMLIWIWLTILLLVTYLIFWMKKEKGKRGILYGLAMIPVILFLMNGILLRHPVLIAASLIFGVFHCVVVRENT